PGFTIRCHMSNMSWGVTGLLMGVGSGDRRDDPSVPRDEFLDARVDQLAVLASAEDAVMAHAFGLEVLLVARRDAAREPLRRLGLVVAGDVVQLTLDPDARRSLASIGTN